MWVPQPHECVSGHQLERFLNDRLLRHRLGRKLDQSCFAGMRMIAAKSFHEDMSVLKLVIIVVNFISFFFCLTCVSPMLGGGEGELLK